jgi:hypothetical protein
MKTKPNKATRVLALIMANDDGTRLKTLRDGAIVILNPGVTYSTQWIGRVTMLKGSDVNVRTGDSGNM